MRSAAKLSRQETSAQIADLLRLPNLRFGEHESVAWALERSAQGADFPDMLHVALSSIADSFTTFDKGVALGTAGDGVRVETLG